MPIHVTITGLGNAPPSQLHTSKGHSRTAQRSAVSSGAADLRGSLSKPTVQSRGEGATALYSRKRKGNEGGVEPNKRAVTAAKGTEPTKAAETPRILPKSGGADAEKDKSDKDEVDDQLEHARTKIADLERKQEEFRARAAAAQKQMDDYKREIQSRGALETKLSALRAEAEVVRHDAHTAAESRQRLEKSIEAVKLETEKLKAKREELMARVRDINKEKSKLRIMLDATDGLAQSQPQSQPQQRRGADGAADERFHRHNDATGAGGGATGIGGGGIGRGAAGARAGGKEEARDRDGASGRRHEPWQPSAVSTGSRDDRRAHPMAQRQSSGWEQSTGAFGRDARDTARGSGGEGPHGGGGRSDQLSVYADDGDM